MKPLYIALAICLMTWCVPGTGHAAGRSSGKSLAAVIEQLKPPHTLSERTRAAEALAVYGEAAVEDLVRLLRSDEWRTRYYACLALSRLGPKAKAAVPELMAIAADANQPAQYTAVVALGRIGPDAADAVPVLFQLAGGDDWEIRNCAARALAELGASAVPVLVGQLRISDPTVSRSACAVIRCMGPKAKEAVPMLVSLVAEAGEELRNAIFVTLGEIGSPAVNDLTCLLRHEDADVRRLAAMALCRLRTEAAPTLSALCHATDDSDSNVRFWAVGALGEIGDSGPEVADCLIRTSLDDDADVRWQTARALQMLNLGASAEEVHSNLLKDPHPAVRARAEQIGIR